VNKGRSIANEFKEFLLRGNVVELAVAVVIGAAFGAVVASLVENLLTPLIAAIFGKQDFANLTFTINGSVFKYGSFINALITFLTIAAAVFFFVVRPYNWLQERRAKGEEEPPEPTEEVKVLSEIRDLLVRRS
jgi:large conductance mechanosensitive channel